MNGEWVSRFEVNISRGGVLGWSFVFGAEAADVAWSSKALVVSFSIIVWVSDCLLFSVVVSEVPPVALKKVILTNTVFIVLTYVFIYKPFNIFLRNTVHKQNLKDKKVTNKLNIGSTLLFSI